MSSHRPDAHTDALCTPEFRLLLHCLREGALPPEFVPPDWDLLLCAAERHAVLPLVHRALARHGQVPATARETLESLFRVGLAKNLFLSAELLRLLDGLSQHGISVLPYKGPTLAQSLYGDIALRSFSDLDLLVRMHDVQPAAEALEALGYVAQQPVPPDRRRAHLALASEQMFRRREGAALVELQWRIAPSYFSVDFDFEWFWRTAVRVPLGSCQVPALAPEALLLALAVHGAKHGWESLVWIVDIAQLLESHPGLDWDSVLRHARFLGIERLLFLALVLAEKLTGAALPVAVRQQAASDTTVPWLVQRVEWKLAGELHGVPNLTDHCFSLGGRERWRDRFRYVARIALTPNPRDWALLPLPSPLAPLYFVVRAIRMLGRMARFAGRRVFGASRAPHSEINT